MHRITATLLALFATNLLAAQFTDLPPLNGPTIVTTTFEDGRWHKRPTPSEPGKGDNTGDGTVLLVIDGDGRVGIVVKRMGTPPPGGAFWRTTYESFPYEGWTGNQQQPPIKGMPGRPPYSQGNIDTHHGFQHPFTLDVEWFSGVKPGYRQEWHEYAFPLAFPERQVPPSAAGVVFSIQRSTQHTLAAEPENFTRYLDELWLTPHPDAPWEHPIYYVFNNSYWGGVAEGAGLIDTLNFPTVKGVGYYTAKTREDPDAFGQRHRSRIGRYVFDLEGPNAMQPVRVPAPGPESYVWDPIRDGAGGAYGSTNETAIWGTDNGILQMSVFFNPYDGRHHLLCWQRKPHTGQGKVNRSIGLYHAWSDTAGLTWNPDSKNPIFTKESLGWPEIGGANQMNSPHGLIDPWTKRGFIFMWGNETGPTNAVGTRLYCFQFELN